MRDGRRSPTEFILGIETSCDDTSAAVLDFHDRLVSNVIFSQTKEHEVFGGVVPEVASRCHLEAINSVVKLALEEAKITFSDLSAIAVTNRPGLIGALLVGLTSAKAMAYSLDIPLIPINHLRAHLVAIFIKSPNHVTPPNMVQPEFPYLGLLVSGGHTAIYLVRGFDEFELISQTRDDAAGEALDKGGKLLGLPYPGGVYLDQKSQIGNPEAVPFPRPMPQKSILDFSFSGIKTSLSDTIKANSNQIQESPKFFDDVAASYLESVLNHLLEKTINVIEKFQINDLVVAGGVAACSRLREKLRILSQKNKTRVWIPDPTLCTDNGAMIAELGAKLFNSSNQVEFSKKDLTLNAYANVN